VRSTFFLKQVWTWSSIIRILIHTLLRRTVPSDIGGSVAEANQYLITPIQTSPLNIYRYCKSRDIYESNYSAFISLGEDVGLRLGGFSGEIEP